MKKSSERSMPPLSDAFFEHLRNLKEISDSWLYGKTGGMERIARLAEQLNGLQGIDPEETKPNPTDSKARALFRSERASNLADWTSRVLKAIDELDDDFFLEVASAIRLLRKSKNPPAKQDALFWAIMFADEFRSKGIEPTKGQVKEAVEAWRTHEGRTSGTVLWQEIWKHPELAGLKDGKRGRKPAEPSRRQGKAKL